MFHIRGQPTTQTQTTGTATAGRARSILLVLTLLTAFAATLVGLAPAAAQDDASLEVTPTSAVVDVNRPIVYTARVVEGNNPPQDVTKRTILRFEREGPCTQSRLEPGKVLCTEAGSYKVTGFLGDPVVSSDPVTLTVVAKPVRPRITSVAPRSSPPNREVMVKGTTGSCNQTGTLTVEGIAVDSQTVTGAFTARFTILPGTFPGRYLVGLSVDCDRQTQSDRRGFRVRNRPPRAAEDSGITSGSPVRIDVTDNDTDPDGDDGYKTVVEAGPPLHGRAVVDDQAIVYHPGAGFVDRDQFTYRHCDVVDAGGKTDCGSGTVTVTRPDPEPADDPDAVTDQGQSVPILVTKNDTSPNPAKLHVRTQPKHGKAEVKDPRDGNIIYKPDPDFTGEDSFEYDYCEGVDVRSSVANPATCPRATVTVTVKPPRPEAVDDPDVTTEQDKHVDIDVMRNDKHPVADKLQVRDEPAPKGAAEVQSNGTIRYTPPTGGFTGEDSFQYDYCRSVIGVTARAACDPATVTVNVTRHIPPAIEKVSPNPTPPNKDVEVTGTTGSCNQAGTLILHIRQGTDVPVPVTGGQDGRFTVSLRVPRGTFVGTYRLELEVECDGQVQVDEEELVVANKAPDAVDDQAETREGTPVTIPVTDNDTDPDGDDGYQTSLEVGQPAHGKTDKQSGDRVLYTPDTGFSGVDQFSYTFCDIVDANGATDCDSAIVRVTVIGDKTPVAVNDPDETTVEERPVSILVTENDTNPDFDKLQVVTNPKGGTAVVQETPRDGHILYSPRKGFTGEDSFTYDYCRPVPNVTVRATCVPATVTVDVTAPPTRPAIETVAPNPTPPNREVVVTGTTGSCNQAGTLVLDIPRGTDVEATVTGAFEAKLRVPGGTFVGTYRLALEVDCRGRAQTVEKPLEVVNKAPDAVDDAVLTPADTPVTIDVTGNDPDPDGDDGYKTSLEVGQAARGTAERQSGDRVRYTPDGGPSGEDRFTYTFCDVVDARGATHCDTATVTVSVGRRRPVPVDDPDETTLRDQPVVVDVMKNDRDPDAALLQVKQPARPGAKAEARADGTVLYTPAAGLTGADTFQYDYCGGPVSVTATGGACPSATVTVDVTDDPVISSVEPDSTSPGKPVEVVGNTGSCNRAGTLALLGTSALGTVTGEQDGSFTGRLTVPAGTFPGPHRIELRVDCRGQLQRAEAGLTVTNQAPVAADDTESTTRDQAVRIRVTGNDRDPDDPDGHRTLVLVTGQPARGTAQEQADLTVLYTPQAGFIGTDRFQYSHCDDVLNAAGGADCGTATVTVTVTDTPVISSVEPAATSPGKPVEVVGNTGSCDRAGTLTFSGAVDLRVDVTGDQNGGFTTTFTVPEGTFPRVYTLELGVDCNGQLQRAEAELMVANQAPVAVDDEATTAPDTSTTIDVTGNDRDPDDPDTYRTFVVADQPDHGTAQGQPDLSVLYTPESGFVGTDRFRYSLCDDVLDAGGEANCGTATVTVQVDAAACAPSQNQDPRLRVEPDRGPGGTRLRITATVDRALATCQLRLLLGGTPLAPDVSVGDDGSISADREVPGDLTPGPNPMRLATMTAETLGETSFEVVDDPPPPSRPYRLLLGAGALLAGFLARLAFRRWWGKSNERDPGPRSVEPLDDLRAKPHTRPVEASVGAVSDNTRTSGVRLEPHADRGIQAVETMEEVTR